MTGRAYMGELLIQVWLKSIKKLVSYLMKSECTKREFEKNFRGSRKLQQEVCDENERSRKKQRKMMRA